VQSKLLFVEKEEEDDDIFEDAHFTAFCISSSFLRERERERERVGRTALNVNAKRQQLTENGSETRNKKEKPEKGVYLGF
tara:strand:- start:1001 stop:1240 length:240 start_codon:yes stop_codon:yes gene_type:complete